MRTERALEKKELHDEAEVKVSVIICCAKASEKSLKFRSLFSVPFALFRRWSRPSYTHTASSSINADKLANIY
jgi:tRNA splicing ligase